MRVEGPVDVAGTTADGRPFYETYVTEKLTGIGMYLSLSADCSAAEDGSGWRAMERGGKETGKPKHSPPPPCPLPIPRHNEGLAFLRFRLWRPRKQTKPVVHVNQQAKPKPHL